MITNLEMFRILKSSGCRIKENVGDKDYNMIVVEKNGITLHLEWCPKFSTISAKPTKVNDIISLQCAGAIKNIVAVKKWCCDETDIKNLCKCVDIITEAYDKIRKL